MRGEKTNKIKLFSNIEVQVDSKTLKVGGGATAQRIQEAAFSHGLMVPLGTAPTVGVGMLLQGGIGHLSRSCGLSLDVVVAAEVCRH